MKKRKSKKSSSWKTLGKVLLFIIKIPYYLVILIYYILKGIYSFIIWLINLFKKVEVNAKRNKMKAREDDFKVVHIDKGDYKKFENDLFSSDSKIGLILGARGSGKTAFGIKLLEKAYFQTKRKCYAIGFSKSEMPSWINIVSDISSILNNSFVLIDEGGILFSSRSSMTNANKFLSQLILIARHKNLTIFFISQNSSNIEINVIRQADFLVLKHSSLLQKDFERKIIKNIYEKIDSNFDKYINNKGVTYIYSDQFRGFISNNLPSFWKESISKSFR
jgi:hypothetical protein